MNYGTFGGQYVSQKLKNKLSEINDNFNGIKKNKQLKKDNIIVVSLSGRGDKDIDIILNYKGEEK